VLLRLFAPWLEAEGLALESVDQRAMNRWIVHLQQEGGPRKSVLTAASVHTYGRAVNHFLSWARREGELTADARARAPKPDRRLLDVLSRDEIQRMEDAADTERDKLIVRVLADTGVRVGELLSLRVDSLRRHGREHYLRVFGKGGKERDVPISSAVETRLRRYAERTRPSEAGTDRLFLTLRRRPDGDYAPLTARGVELLIRGLGEQAAIGKRVYPHLLRHSFATWWLRRGGSPLSLKDTLGHESLEMISGVYSHLTPADRHDEFMRLLRADDGDG
jgi:site-specific recombinase XerD